MIQLYQTLDLRPIGIPQTLRLSQYDSDFEIIFELTNFDGTWILDTNTTAEVQGTKTDGHGYSADAVFDDQLKTVTIAGDVQMTAAAGRNTFEVVLFHDGDRLGSKNFILDVERAALDAETTASDSKIKNFTEMTEAATQAAETATAAAEAAEEAAASIVPGLSDEAKQALLDCFAHVIWDDEHGQDYYDALEDALYTEVKTVTSITAAFTQAGAAIYEDTPLDDLEQYLVVTVHYSDDTSNTTTAYTLSGTLATGQSTITVSYVSGANTFTDTFTVAVGYKWLYPAEMTSLEGGFTRDDSFLNRSIFADVSKRFTKYMFGAPYGDYKFHEMYLNGDPNQGVNHTNTVELYPVPIPPGVTTITINFEDANTDGTTTFMFITLTVSNGYYIAGSYSPSAGTTSGGSYTFGTGHDGEWISIYASNSAQTPDLTSIEIVFS